MIRKNAQRGSRPTGPQHIPFTHNNMMDFFAPPPQPNYSMMSQQFFPGMLPGMLPQQQMMNPMLGFQQNSMFMSPSYGVPMQSFSTFNPMGSAFVPQQPAFIQPNVVHHQPYVQPFQPMGGMQQQPRPFIPQQNIVPPPSNIMGFGQPQNQYPQIGFQGGNQVPGFNQQSGFNQVPGFNQQPQGFNQQSGFNQPPGFNQANFFQR